LNDVNCGGILEAVNADDLSGFLQLVLPPTVGAVVTVVVGGVATRVRAGRGSGTRPPPNRNAHLISTGPFSTKPRLRSGSATDAGTARRVREPASATPRERLQRWIANIGELIDTLPPLERRASVWKATLIGSIGIGFGVAGYFRTRADVLIGIVLTAPFLVALPFFPDETTSAESAEPTGPYWVYAFAYTSMGLTGLYSYLRAVSSNRRLEEEALPSRLPRKSWEERRDILGRELRLLVAAGWTIESVGEVQATVSRLRRPNHALHLVLTLLTAFVWGVVWLARTLSARQRQAVEYRLVSVDEFGHWSLENLPASPSVR
jgi:hypothetical protein